jgi:polyisoprenoid-binding protein YceI
VVSLVVAVVVVLPYLVFHVIEGSAPPSLKLPTSGLGSGPIVAGPVSGSWSVGTGSQAGYRVQEILFGQHHTAVGRTSKVGGGMIISGTVVAAAHFTVNMASVNSDQGARDVQFHGYIMATYDHPNATFELTQPIQLGAVPAPGAVITVNATGTLTLRGVSRTVTLGLRAERTASGIDVNAEIPITFSDWHIPNPSFAIAQVGKTGLIEVLLLMVPVAR